MVNDFEWSPDQQKALSSVHQWMSRRDKPYYLLAGYAGTGKSTLARYFAESSERVLYAAYTGKAAHVLRSNGIDNACTIHHLIYKPQDKSDLGLRELRRERDALAREVPPPEKKLAKLDKKIALELANLRRPDFFLNTESELEDADLLIIDEYSMVDEQTGRDLLSFGCPILALGDPGQLPPVQGRQFFREKPDTMMTRILRQAEANPIIMMSLSVREGRTLGPGKYGESRVLRRAHLSADEVGKMMGESDQVLVGLNRTRKQLNQAIRKMKGFTDPLPQKGDKLVCLRNNHNEGLLNGQTWTVTHARHKAFLTLHLENEDGDKITCLAHPDHFLDQDDALDPGARKRANEFDFGYAMTVHKCVHPNTLVESDQGLLPIRLLKKNGHTAALDGKQERYENLFCNPAGKALQIVCEDGYSVTVTPEHQTEVIRKGLPELIPSTAVKTGDWMRVRLGVSIEPTKRVRLPATPEGDVRCNEVTIPTVVNNDLAEFLGLMVADGTLFKRGVRLLKRHRDVALRFGELLSKLFKIKPHPVTTLGATGFEACSSILSAWLTDIGGLRPRHKYIPECILRSSSAIHAFFLRGLFEDGGANVKKKVCDHIQFVTKYEDLAKQAQVMLLRLGIISSTVLRNGLWNLYIYGSQAGLFRERVGFISQFKQRRLRNCRTNTSRYRVPLFEALIDELFARSRAPLDRQNVRHARYTSRAKLEKLRDSIPDLAPVIDELLSWHWVRVKKILATKCKSMCMTVTPSHRFLQNGFPHGNSQGSQWDNVVLVNEWTGSNRQQWLYTGITRAAKSITILQ